MAQALAESKTYTITLPPEVASKADALAAEEGSEVSAIIAEAIDALFDARFMRRMANIWEYASTCNPTPYTEEDVVRLTREVRAEMAEERAQKSFPAAKAS
jgi:hypothetical protein